MLSRLADALATAALLAALLFLPACDSATDPVDEGPTAPALRLALDEIQERPVGSDQWGPVHATRTYSYDGAGRLRLATYESDDDFRSDTWYTYDGDGHLIQEVMEYTWEPSPGYLSETLFRNDAAGHWLEARSHGSSAGERLPWDAMLSRSLAERAADGAWQRQHRETRADAASPWVRSHTQHRTFNADGTWRETVLVSGATQEPMQRWRAFYSPDGRMTRQELDVRVGGAWVTAFHWTYRYDERGHQIEVATHPVVTASGISTESRTRSVWEAAPSAGRPDVSLAQQGVGALRLPGEGPALAPQLP